MKIIISNIIEIQEPTKDIIDYCKEKLVYPNPEYEKKRRMGFWLKNTPKTISLYDLYDDTVCIPVGCFNDIWNIHPIRADYKEYSNVVPINITSTIKLRDYQKPCLQAVKSHVNGVLVLPAGLGKTQCALEVINHLQQKTLWITHTQDLLVQSKTRCENNMTCKTSVITEGKSDLSGDIVFATVQTLVNMVEKQEIAQDTFGMLIVDECHRISHNIENVGMFEKCIDYFASRYKIGLTATFHRADGLEATITKLLGSIIYEVRKEKDYFVGYYEDKEVCRVIASDFQIPVDIKFIKTPYDITDKDVYDKDGGTIQFTKLVSDIAMDSSRNNKIIKILKGCQGSTIILSDRVDQLKLLQRYFTDGVVIDGKTKKTIREQALKDVSSGKVKYLFASYKLAKEGLDCPILTNLVLATPVKDKAVVIQSLGRIQRPYQGKTKATVYDLLDDVSSLYRFYTMRKVIYKKEGYVMTDET
jgi:superfamily II DNA or RNA helicase